MTRSTAPAPAGATTGSLAAAMCVVPSRLVVAFFWLVLVVCVAILVGAFTPPVVLGGSLLAVAVTWRMVPTPLPAGRDVLVGALAALALAGLWVVVNLPFASEILLVQRDPGFLTLQGIWLTSHADPSIPLGLAPEVASQVGGAAVVSDAFWQDGSSMYSQGASTVPGVLAVAGWAGGISGVLAANVLVGALALLAVYDLARRLTGPLWGLVPAVALALTLPMLYFTRTPFTEPTNIVLALGGLAVLWGAFADPAAWRFALGGAMVGGSALGRIDGAAVVAGLILGVGLVVAGTRDPARRSAGRRGLLVVSAASASMVVLGYLDLRLNSRGYLEDHASLYRQLIGLLIACVLGALVLEVLTRSPRVTTWLASRRTAVATLAAVGVVVVALALASRPLWMQAHWFEPGSSYAEFIAANQRAGGVAVDGTRSYDEMTVSWLSWYLGVHTVVLAVIGAAVLLHRAIERRRPEIVVLLAALGVPALLYLVFPRITPDHVWAMRRFLPIVIPASLLCAAWILQWMLMRARWPWARIGVGALTVGVLLFPVGTWGSLVSVVEYGGRRAEVTALCDAVAGRPVVAVRPSGPTLLPTLRIVCGSDVIEVTQPPSEQDLAAARRAWGDPSVVVASYAPEGIPWSAEPAPWRSTAMTRWPHSINRPEGSIEFTSQIWLGTVAEDGTVDPLA